MRTPRVAVMALCLLALATMPGCLRRKIRITSTPPGALVHLNGVEIGRTPAEAAFKFYGVYDVRLELDGYEPLHAGREAGAPFWEWPGVDLAATVIPADIENTVEWHFVLESSLESTRPADEAAADVGERARELRDQLFASDPL